MGKRIKPRSKRLYRPVGLEELELIVESGFKAFPPRLPQQPIFYPVLELDYARQIARGWNVKDELSGFVGFVTEFDVARSYVDRFEEHIVGGRKHRELWVPAEELDDFNRHLIGLIRVREAYYGEAYVGPIPAFPELTKV